MLYRDTGAPAVLSSLANLVSLEFIARLEQAYFSDFSKNAKKQLNMLNPSIREWIQALSEHFLQNPSKEYHASDLAQVLQNKGLTDVTSLNVLEILHLNYLLQTDGRDGYCLDTELIWANQIADVITRKQEEEWLSGCKVFSAQTFYDSLFECALLKHLQKIETVPRELWESLWGEHSIWFAALHFPENYLQEFCNYVFKKVKKEKYRLPLADENVFSFLYFLKYVPASVMTYERKMNLLHGLYERCRELQLEEYVLSVMRYAISSCVDEARLFNSLNRFIGCEQLNIDRRVAGYLVDKLSEWIPEAI